MHPRSLERSIEVLDRGRRSPPEAQAPLASPEEPAHGTFASPTNRWFPPHCEPLPGKSPSPALRCPQPRLGRWRGPAASLRSCPSRPQTIPRFLLHLNVVGAGNISVSLRQLSDSSSAETHSGTLRFFLLADAGFELRTDLGSADLTVDSTFGTPSTKEGRQVFKVAGRSSSLMPFRERSSFARARPTRPRPAPKSRPECARRCARPPRRPRGE